MNNNIKAIDEQITLTEKARVRLEVIQRINAGQLTQKRGALELGISTRQLRRLQAQYREHGSRALISKRVGKPSNNRLSDKVRQQAVFLMKHQYEGVGPTVGHRHLTQEHGLKLSVESLRKLMIEQGLWRQKPRHAPAIIPSASQQLREQHLRDAMTHSVEFRPQMGL